MVWVNAACESGTNRVERQLRPWDISLVKQFYLKAFDTRSEIRAGHVGAVENMHLVDVRDVDHRIQMQILHIAQASSMVSRRAAWSTLSQGLYSYTLGMRDACRSANMNETSRSGESFSGGKKGIFPL